VTQFYALLAVDVEIAVAVQDDSLVCQLKFEHDAQYCQEHAVVYKADQVENAPAVVIRAFLAGMVELIVRKQMSVETILAEVPGKGY